MSEPPTTDALPAVDPNCEGLLRALLDAMPCMVFVLDGQQRVLSLNRSAAETFGLDPSADLERLVGELVDCANSGGGCGQSAQCPACGVRGAVQLAVEGQRAHRVRTRRSWKLGAERVELSLLVTAAPFAFAGRALVLLTLEDVTDLVALRGLLPICSYCKKIRQEAAYWVAVEKYVQEHSDALFTHTICEECLDRHHPGVRARLSP